MKAPSKGQEDYEWLNKLVPIIVSVITAILYVTENVIKIYMSKKPSSHKYVQVPLLLQKSHHQLFYPTAKITLFFPSLNR